MGLCPALWTNYKRWLLHGHKSTRITRLTQILMLRWPILDGGRYQIAQSWRTSYLRLDQNKKGGLIHLVKLLLSLWYFWFSLSAKLDIFLASGPSRSERLSLDNYWLHDTIPSLALNFSPLNFMACHFFFHHDIGRTEIPDLLFLFYSILFIILYHIILSPLICLIT